MSSTDSINYLVRPNKNVERKVIFECLFRLSAFIDWSDYRYIGFGAFSFADFILAHKNLNISDLISIEKRAAFTKRVKFNRPYRCIDIRIGETSVVLPELGLGDRNSIMWLDYDGTVDEVVLSDIRYTCEHIQTNSVIAFTMNAHKGSIAEHQQGDTSPTIPVERGLRAICKDLVPSTLEASELQLSGYPRLLARLMFVLINRSIRKAGRPDKFFPLFNFSYKDDSPMITIGGMICDDAVYSRLVKEDIYNSHITGEEQFKIDVPPLTVREKLAIDHVLPNTWPLSRADMAKIPFEIRDSQLKAFLEFYKHYPVFLEGCF